jgi:hypothetical protein
VPNLSYSLQLDGSYEIWKEYGKYSPCKRIRRPDASRQFINAFAQATRAPVSDKLQAVSDFPEVYRVSYEDKDIVLVEMPGFDDDRITDEKTVEKIYDWLKNE